MAIHKLALIRYKTLDECFRNRIRKWTLEDLVSKVSQVIYDAEGIENGISRRTIQADIQVMRSSKLGYNAPIIVQDKKYYCYDDPAFTIVKNPVNKADVSKMKEIVGLLKQFSGFNYFNEFNELVTRLENHVNKTAASSTDCIQFEYNQLLRGLTHLNPLYQAVFHKRALLLEYQSFKATIPQQQIYFPYLLKEYRNRWFLICRTKKSTQLITLALDRIITFQELPYEPFQAYEGIPFDRYYSDLIGVTKSERDRPFRVILEVDASNAPYIKTKPLHASQRVEREDAGGMIIRLDVVLNFELEREILGFGESIKVLAPRILQSRIRKRITAMAKCYAPPVPHA
ncbi:helix-turn-helix transcriptional regulator [Flavihumibacter petaseus]|uniref:Uncharacterized protein n=1 Tax=Flavihumibacter petaseus NBRC 106054 TaxID=1220578 RepID=A0A0E9MZV4_9BACT|nr:WYL domain-containing protein [Flavihumibacter petaseus]GAO42660.1 hypothetical protein FPE01S_01_16750 [Flavihumibacter petaseus NBRC 106054]